MQNNLGLVGILSIHDRYLQAHKDNGEMHGSNSSRNEEETWFLLELDKGNHIYALQNWDNHQFLSKKPSGCLRADVDAIGGTEQCTLVASEPYGTAGRVAIRWPDGTFMGTNDPGDDDNECHGEVTARSGAAPPKGSDGWPGWWRFVAADTPEPGRNFWNAAGSVLVSVAISELTAALLA